jgi:hypothetical protein
VVDVAGGFELPAALRMAQGAEAAHALLAQVALRRRWSL